MIVNKIVPQTAEHFDSNGESVGFLNEYESIDFRIQIAENRIDGCYLVFGDEKYYISNKGRFLDFPHNELYHQNKFAELFKAQKTREND